MFEEEKVIYLLTQINNNLARLIKLDFMILEEIKKGNLK